MKKYDASKFGRNLAEVMLSLGINQTELSEMTGLTQAAVSQIISGKREPALGTVVRVLNAVPVKFERLVR